MARKDDDGTLDLDMPGPKRLGPGPVYQGVAKQIREMIESDMIDRDLDAGAIAAARSAARSVDEAAGHNQIGRVAAGMQQAALHAALLSWLEKLAGKLATDDPFAKMLAEFNEENRDGRAASAHPEV